MNVGAGSPARSIRDTSATDVALDPAVAARRRLRLTTLVAAALVALVVMAVLAGRNAHGLKL